MSIWIIQFLRFLDLTTTKWSALVRNYNLGLALVVLLVACSPKTTEEYLQLADTLKVQGQYQQAIIELKNALSDQPSSQQARYMLGEAYFMDGQFANAEKELRLAKELGASDDSILPLIVKSMYYQNDFERAFDYSKDYQTSNTNTLSTVRLYNYLSHLRGDANQEPLPFPEGLIGDDMFIAKAYQSLANKNPIDAQHQIQQFVDPTSEQIEKAMVMAITFSSLGDFDAAIEQYDIVVKSYPQYYIARFQLVEILVVSDQLERALQEVETLFKINEKSGYANFLKSKIYFKLDSFELALLHAETAVQNGYNDTEANFLAGASAYKIQKFETARNYLTKISKNVAPDNIANKILAEINIRLGYTNEAIEQLPTLGLTSKDKASVLSTAAIQQFQYGNFSKAKQFIDEANKADPGNAENLLKEGFIRLSTNDLGGLEYLNKTIEYDDSVNEAWMLIAETHLKNNKPNEALQLAQKWQQTNQVGGLLLEGYIKLQIGENSDAKKVLKQVLAIEPDNIGALRFLMLVNAQEQNFTEAQILSEKLIGIQPSKLTTIIDYINIGIAQNATNRIENGLLQLAEKNKGIQEPVLGLALLYSWKKEPDKAISLLSQKANADASYVMMIKGDIYRSQGKSAQAYEQYKNWFSKYPRESTAWFRALDILQNQNNVKEALIVSTEALRYFPNEPRLKGFNALMLALNGKVQEARTQFSSIMQSPADLPTLLYFDGQIALKEKRFQVAQQLLSQYYAINPTFETAKPLAFALQELGKIEQGGELLEKELNKLDSPFIEVHSTAEYYADNHKLDDAIRIYDALLNRYPQDYITINNYASVLILKGEYDKASELVRVAMILKPNTGFSLDLYGWLQFNLGNVEESFTFFTKALELIPNNIEIQMHLADNYIALNRKAEAKKLLAEIVPITKAQRRYFKEIEQKL